MTQVGILAITGTTRGIGHGLAEHFLDRGFVVEGCARGAATIEHANYQHGQVDVSDEVAVRDWIGDIRRRRKRIDGFIANAGHVGVALMMSVTPGTVIEDFSRQHVMGGYYALREASKAMLAQRSGRIVAITSAAVPMHLEGASAYVATKAAVVAMAKVLAAELAPLGITCNCVAPGLVMTGPSQNMGEAWAERFVQRQTIKRPITIQEIAATCEFLLSPGASAVTGQVITLGLVT